VVEERKRRERGGKEEGRATVNGTRELGTIVKVMQPLGSPLPTLPPWQVQVRPTRLQENKIIIKE